MSYPEAKIIKDSISPDGVRLTTMEVKLHRFVLAELNTHRVFSRNSASSRAIPVKKLLERVKNDPALPVWWGKNQAGMQANEELNPWDIQRVKTRWLVARDQAVKSVEGLLELNLHKQLANRILEPWLWHNVIVTATEWTNFFSQRCHPDAQPEMRAAAMAMQKAYYSSEPKLVKYGQWHLPYIDFDIDVDIVYDYLDNDTDEIPSADLLYQELKKISAARCARVSYLTHDGIREVQKDLDLYNKLASANPMHASPFEHIATPALPHGPYEVVLGNLRGWHQMRHQFPNESVSTFTVNHPDLVEQNTEE